VSSFKRRTLASKNCWLPTISLGRRKGLLLNQSPAPKSLPNSIHQKRRLPCFVGSFADGPTSTPFAGNRVKADQDILRPVRYEWRPGVCGKPRIKCGVCKQRQFLPVTDRVIYNHLAGQHTIGIYPLLKDDTCYFLATDFDKSSWQEDALAYLQSCKELHVSAALEISRSGQGAHVWIFFSEAVPATDARRLGAALISYTCSRTRQLSLDSYDRFFPNQDTLPKGGFGNLIALPLQKTPREKGFSLFVDDNFKPYEDQWAFLAALDRLSADELSEAISRATAGGHPLDVSFLSEEEASKPWQRPEGTQCLLEGPLPKELDIVLANQIYIEKAALPQPLANRLIRLAAFQNPEFYKAQAMRLPVWNKPRIIGCAENYPKHIGLPRGCLEELQHLLAENGVNCALQD